METIAGRLKFARKTLRHMTQEELTAACGYEYQSRVSSYERGEREPGSDDLRALAKALRVSLAWLATGEGEPLAVAVPTPAQVSPPAASLISTIQWLDSRGAMPAALCASLQSLIETMALSGQQVAPRPQPSLTDVVLPEIDRNAAYVRKALQNMAEEYAGNEEARAADARQDEAEAEEAARRPKKPRRTQDKESAK